MTDITELAQREKFEAWAEECNALPWGYLKKRRIYTGFYSEHTYTSLWAAWKAAGAELVEALEKAQAKADVYDMLRDDYGLREKGVGLADFVDWQAKRIAELESRTVKLPPTFWYEHDDLSRDVPVLDKRLVKKMLREAGIKVEAE